MKRLFIGIPISEEVKDRIKPLYNELIESNADLRLVKEENFHFTLKFLGNVLEKEIPKIEESIRKGLSRQGPFNISLKGTGRFPNNGPIHTIWLGVVGQELNLLIKRISLGLKIFWKEKKEDIPHLTLTRVKSDKSKKQLQKIIQKYSAIDFGTVKVWKVILYESELRKEGPAYKMVKEFGLS